jgi:hypothetical protein
VSKWQSVSSIGETEKIHKGPGQGSGVGGDDGHVFGKNFPGEKQYTVMMKQPVLLSPRFMAKSSHIFIQSP